MRPGPHMPKAKRLPISMAHIFPVLNEKWISISDNENRRQPTVWCDMQPCSPNVGPGILVIVDAWRKMEKELFRTIIIMAYGSIVFIHRIHSMSGRTESRANWVECALHTWETGHCQRWKAIDVLFSRWIAWDRANVRATCTVQRTKTCNKNAAMPFGCRRRNEERMKNRETQ